MKSPDEPYEVPFKLAPQVTRQVSTASDGMALQIVSCSGPAVLVEDGVVVGSFRTMGEARDAAQQRYEERLRGRPAMGMTPPMHEITWTTVP